MMTGDFPPSSKVTCFKLLLAAAAITSLPTSVEPAAIIQFAASNVCLEKPQIFSHKSFSQIYHKPQWNFLLLFKEAEEM
jgi:hypothetical protein